MSGRTDESLRAAKGFYQHWATMVRLMELKGYMAGPAFWVEQKALSLLLGWDPSDKKSLAPFQPVRASSWLLPSADSYPVLLLPMHNFCYAPGEANPCEDERVRAECGYFSIHFKGQWKSKCMLYSGSCMRLAGFKGNVSIPPRYRIPECLHDRMTARPWARPAQGMASRSPTEPFRPAASPKLLRDMRARRRGPAQPAIFVQYAFPAGCRG